MKRYGKVIFGLISVLTALALVLGSVPTVSYAEVLSGADSVTLTREPQQTPDGLGASNLGALEYADPSAQIDLVQPPETNNQGDAQVNFPISVPPGRAGVQPDLSLSYSSMGGNSWVGFGWDLTVGSVTVDTRWGVPRYSPTQESETYLLDGDQLSPTAVRSSLEPRQDEKVFQRRVEGSFERIVRHSTVPNSAPGHYWWEVTDKNGTHRYYGGTPEGGRDENAILTDANHHEYIWGLKQVRDISGNTITYSYDKANGTGVGLYNTSIGQDLYLASITYTGSITSNTSDDPAYEVDFMRESRPDVQVDGRGGFLRVTSERLKQIVIKYRGTVVRSYSLNYTVGAFGKSLLASVDQYGQAGSPILATTTFSYYDDLKISGNTYHGFDANQTQDWNTQTDNVSSGVDLSSFGDGKASALGGTQSTGGDGRVYLGFNLYDGQKEGSAGVGLVFKGEDDSALLEMIDINGDNLPDKVFVQGGQIVYRLNQSGPNGTISFSGGSPLQIQGINQLSKESNFMFSVGLEAYFGVNVMYNHAWAWTWGKAYFTDVNGDNLPDFIDQGVVYFNHLDANGRPVFTQDSNDTRVPIDGGSVDPSLKPDHSAIEAQIKAQAPLQDVLRRWVAPWDGTVKIEGDVQLLQPASGSPIGDGVRVAIQHEGSELWSDVIPGGDYNPRTPSGVDSINVSRGDDIYFRLQSIEDGASDQVDWNPTITYLNISPTPDANGLDVYSYQAATDFTLAGRSDSFVVMPLTGTVQVSGDFNKLRLTTDDISIQVYQNDNLVMETPVGRDQTGITPFSVQIPVIGSSKNVSGDKIRLALKIDSPTDLSAFSWTPQLTYLSATKDGQPVPVVDQNGQPTIQMYPPVDTQIYPADDLSAPQDTWTAPDSGDVTLTPSASFVCTQDCSNNPLNGTLTLSVKKKITPQNPGDPPSELVAKKVLTIQGGAIQDSDPSLTFSADKDAEYWIDLSVPQAYLGMDWVSADISASLNGNQQAVTFARHWAYIPADVFPEPYRGWGIAGYNGSDPWGSQPIDESRLFFNKDNYPTEAPTPTDPNNQQPSYPGDFSGTYKNPAQVGSYAYAPVVVFDANGVATGYWRGAKNDLYGSASEQSSSRLGPDSITLPPADFAGASAVTIQSMTQADAIAGGLGGLIGGSYAWGTSQGQIDYLDMNGDQFPDILGNSRIQYSQARGGRDTFAIGVSNLESVRKDSSTSKTLNGGGDAAEIKADSKGKSNTPQSAPTIGSHRQRKASGNSSSTSSGSGDNSETSGSIGISGGIGSSSTNTISDASPGDGVIESELADMNGDGLPDRVRLYSDGRFTVTFNLGYAFDSHEIEWPGGALEQGQSQDTSLAPGLGFSYGSMSFSGGISLASSKDHSLVTWVDLNGDSLPDQLTDNNGVIRVRFNTGASLTDQIDFGSWQQSVIARAQSQDIAGGADFTIGIGPLCFEVDLCYLILNPGFHVDGGMARQEVEIKDVNGDGYPDNVFSVSDNQMAVLLNQTGRTNLLKSVANPLGGSFTLDYTREGNTVAQPFSQWVMSSVDVNDGRPGDGPDHQLTTYQYQDNVYDALERAFLGYQTVTEEQHDTSLTGNPVIRSIVREYRNGNIFDQGLLASETLSFPDGTPFSKQVNTWSMWDVGAQAPANLNPDPADLGLLELTVFPQQVKSEFQRFDSSGALAKSTWNTYTYDALGNITEIFDVGEPDIAADDLTAFTTYTDCTSSTWVSLPNSFRIEDTNGTTLRSRAADVLCENGAITELREDTGSGMATTDLSFDNWGNYNHIVYPPNKNGERYTVDYVYDADRHTDIASVTDSYGLEGTAAYDGLTGQIASQTDANGQLTTYSYDVYGRLTSLTGPYEQGSGNTSVTFEYFPTAPAYAYALAHNFDVFHPGDPIDTASFMDGIGRVTETKQDATLFQGVDQPAVDAMIVSGATEWDALGRAVKQWYPISEPLGSIGAYNYNTATTNPSVVTYDIDDRVVNTVAPDNSVTSTDYGFGGDAEFGTTMFKAIFTDQLGKATTSYSDVRGNQLETAVNHQVGTTQEVLETKYQYDPLQQLIGVTDSGGNQTTHEYDLLGRRTATTTPDGGLVTFAYDLASHKISQVTPNLRAAGGEIHYNYDFDRLTGITYTDGTPNVTYTYGGPGAADNGAGRIIRVEDGARVQQRAYGKQGEVTEETTTMLVHNLVDATEARLTWTTSFAFDTWGRTKSITYPDGEVVSYTYDSGGLISAVTGEKAGISYPYLLRQEYDEFSAPHFALDGNQVATETRYDPATRRLSRQTIDAPGRRIQDLNYTYDLTGNVLSAANNGPTPVSNMMGGTSMQTFAYDDLYRLVSATGTYNSSPNKTRTYTYALTYDDIGNILHKTQADSIINSNPKKVLPQMKTTYDLGYSYNAAPHQPTQIGTQLYTYDLNGNFTGWTDTTSGQNRTVTWDAENRVTSVADQGSTTTYAYTDDGTLGIQRGPGGEAAFVNRYYTVLNGSVAWKDIYAGDQRIATKKQMPDGEPELMEYFLHKDLLGSTNLVTDPSGLIFEHLEYFPGGETWIEENSDIFRVPELYTGSYYDEFRELYNLGARWYEPREQMFYSPEPALVQTPQEVIGDPAMLPAYTYAQSNPLKLVDRNGRDPGDAQNNWMAAVPKEWNKISYLIGKKLNPKTNKHSARFKAFATFKFPPAVSIKLTKDPATGNFKLKNVKLFGIKTEKIAKAYRSIRKK